jgi:hypothetical protein
MTDKIEDPANPADAAAQDQNGDAYPPGFWTTWTKAERDKYFADEAKRYRESKAIKEATGGNSEDKTAKAKKKKPDAGARTQAEKLIALASEVQLFHAVDGTPYADISVNGHRETYRLYSTGFRRWLKRRYHETEKEGGAPNAEAMAGALGMLEAHAHYDGPEREVSVRVGGIDGKVYLDLCDPSWRAVEIDDTGWQIIDAPPVRFRRTTGMKPLPFPLQGGSVDGLRRFLNVKSQDDFILAISWILAAFRPRGPYPVLALAGEHGSAKSTFSAILRALIDPNTAPLRALPREDRDLFIAACNGHVVAFDNISGLPAWISDTLCRLATGAGFAVRSLYTNDEETLFDAARPIILNGIEDIVIRPDLADRALFLTLEAIPRDKRLAKDNLRATFERQRPSILGALLTAVSNGLARTICRAWQILPFGARLAAGTYGARASFKLPMIATLLGQPKALSRPTRLRSRCAPSWRIANPGRARRPSF